MPTVCGAILYRDGKLLLGYRSASRSSYPNVWDIFGGHSESGESLEQTLARELDEELGIAEIHPTFLSKILIEEHALELHVYLLEKWGGNIFNKAPEEHSQLRWFTIEEACELELAIPEYKEIFRSLSAQA
jgi:8-oxo-dGTP diphosphatase